MPPSSNNYGKPPVPPGANAKPDQWLSYLESIHPSEIDLGLDRVLLVLRRLFPRKPRGRIITVAGTNGKGSAVAAIEALLHSAGRTTGAYTSPHLHRYNERVRLNGADISDEALVRAFETVEQARGNTTLTYFEFGTLAAFVAFAESGVEDWVLEVGLGGRLDAVNVLDADFAIITSVDIDHVAFLGSDREVIGFEKAGVLRPGIPAVYADEDAPRSVLQQVSAQKVALDLFGRDYKLRLPEDGAVGDAAKVHLEYRGETIRFPAGPLPVKSVAAAVVAIRNLEPALTFEQIESTLLGLSVPGRFEQLSDHPVTLVDVGHNPHAATWLADRLATMRHDGQRVVAVYGALGDKDVEGVSAAMARVVDQWFLAPLDVPRGLDVQTLAERVRQGGVTRLNQCPSVAEAIETARASAGEDGLVIVFGSFFTVAEARDVLQGDRS